MLKIGDFSKLSRVSIRMLRHYDEIGLLKPVWIDPESGYRYYKAEQLSVAGRINALKDMGFGLSAIGEILPCYEDRDTLKMHLRCNRPYGDPCYCCAVFHDKEFREAEVDVEVQKDVKGSYKDTEHVCFRILPEITVACATCKGSYEQMGGINAAVVAWVADNGYVFDGPMFNIYHVSPHETSNPDEYVTEVCYPVRKM